MTKKRKALIITSSIFAFILTFFMVINMIPKKAVVEGVNPFKKNDVTLISAHRGGAFLNPENTEKAFDHVILETTYADIIEIDIHKTKDNVYVLTTMTQLIAREF